MPKMIDSRVSPTDRSYRTVWIDVSDLFWFFDHFKTPSGIQRLTAEAVAALLLVSNRSFRVCLCRVDEGHGRLTAIRPEDMFDLYRRPIRNPARQVAKRSQLEKVAAELGRFWMRRVRRRVSTVSALTGVSSPEIPARSEDVLMCMGSHWVISGYADLIDRYRSRGLRFAFLCYDLIPLTHRRWIPKSMQWEFQTWFDRVSVQADVIMTISQYTAGRVQRHLSESSKSGSVVTPIRIGHGFPITGGIIRADSELPRLPPSLVGPFALYVSTIEPRKNHLFLFSVWDRLLEEHGSSMVPQLVFVGHRGPMVDDLFQQLENTSFLDSKVVVLADVPDSMLSALYEECTLALYPSLAEGFGLPVAEAIMAGAICVASNKTSIPEVVGDIIDYFDPDDFNEAYRLIQRALLDDDYRANLRLRAQRFVPRLWSVTAEDILQTIERHIPVSTREVCK